MDITQYLNIARRWMWLLILGLVLGIVCGYVVSALQTPIYQASTRVVVSRASMQTASGAASGSNNMYDFFLSDQVLIQTYVELLKASSIFDYVSKIVNYPVSPGQVSAGQVGDTRIISITVEDPNPQHAADIANAVVQALIAQNDELEAGRYKSSDESLQVQISQVEEQIAKIQSDLDNLSTTSVDEQIAEVEKQMTPLQAEVTQLKKDIAILTPAWSAERKAKATELQARLDQVQPLLDLYQQMYTNLTVSGTSGTNTNTTNNPAAARLEKTLSLYQQIYLNLINTREAIRLARMQNTQSVNQIEPATMPTAPVRPLPMQNTLLGGLVGLMLAGGIVFLIEFLDDTLKTPEDVESILEVPVIGYIADMQTDTNENSSSGYSGIHISKQPRSPAAESFRSLRTNLEFAAVDKPLRTILVTSAEASDGKSTISANLATIFAQGGKRVILIDCDLRRPRIHRFVGIQNRSGMTDLFRGSHTLDEVMHVWRDSSAIEFSVITSGSLPPNPAELLGSQKMDHILTELTSRADVVILDSPPSMVADSQVLAAKVDGVVVVTQPGKTHAGAARATHEQLARAGAHIVGAVFNRIPAQHGYYYGGYRYYSPYYYQNSKYLNDQNAGLLAESTSKKTSSRSLAQRISGLVRRKHASDDFEEEMTPRQSLSKNVLDPAGWKAREKKDSAQQANSTLPVTAREQPKPAPVQLALPAENLSDLKKSASQSSSGKASTESQKKAALLPASRRGTDTPKARSEQKKAKNQPLLRKAARKSSFAASAPVSKIKLPPTMKISSTSPILRMSDTPASVGNFAMSGAPIPRHMLDRMVGTDYKFLIERASHERGLDYYAARYKTEISTIAAVNYKLPSPAWVIPVGFTDVAKLPSFTAYEVKERGSTIEALARNLKVNLTDLKYYNGIKDTEMVFTKNWLLVPQSSLPALDPSMMPANDPSRKHQLDAKIGNDLQFVIHKVGEDENLHQYASLYRTSLEAILTITINPPLWAGTLAVIPVGVTDVSGLPRFDVHQTQNGGTAESLARELSVDPNKLGYYNNIASGEEIKPGDWLLIPRSRSSALWRSASVRANV